MIHRTFFLVRIIFKIAVQRLVQRPVLFNPIKHLVDIWAFSFFSQVIIFIMIFVKVFHFDLSIRELIKILVRRILCFIKRYIILLLDLLVISDVKPLLIGLSTLSFLIIYLLNLLLLLQHFHQLLDIKLLRVHIYLFLFKKIIIFLIRQFSDVFKL